jgi:hypothetical protein
MPILSAAVFDNTGKPYDVSKIISKDVLLDEAAYHSYSRVFLPITYVLSYGLQFAALSALFTHTAFWHGKDMWKQSKASLREIGSEKKVSYQPLDQPEVSGAPSIPSSLVCTISATEPNLDNLLDAEDVHSRLMRRYEDVPLWWYVVIGVSMTAVGIFVVE